MELKHLSDIIGQDSIRENLSILITGARRRSEALDHILFHGPSGLGKTTVANVVANEMGVNIKIVSGPSIDKVNDIAAILTNLRAGDILLVQQIESMRKPVIEVMVSAAEEFALDIVIGKGSSARSIRLKLPRFTIIGTTSKLSQVDQRLSTLMLVYDFTPYHVLEIGQIIVSLAKQQGFVLDADTANLMAQYCNGNSSQALTLLGRIQKYALAYTAGQITQPVTRDALAVLGRVNKPFPKGRQPIPDDVKMFVWKRDQGKCAICGNQNNLEFDHIIPVSKGGSNTARNLQLLCESCNRKKSSNIA
ncbi:MAG: HNH endonuclease [Chloroflexi bacterium]|nr:HNH endonuclease [Chloroflexota bacterium]